MAIINMGYNLHVTTIHLYGFLLWPASASVYNKMTTNKISRVVLAHSATLCDTLTHAHTCTQKHTLSDHTHTHTRAHIHTKLYIIHTHAHTHVHTRTYTHTRHTVKHTAGAAKALNYT